MKKNILRPVHRSIDESDFDNKDLSQIIELIQRIKDYYDKNCPGKRIIAKWEPVSYSEDYEVNLYVEDLETDEEYEARLELEKLQEEQNLARKRAQFEALKKELGE